MAGFRGLIVGALGLPALVVAVGLAQTAGDEAAPGASTAGVGTLSAGVRSLIERASDEPVILGMRATRRRLAPDHWQPADEHIAFRLPASSFSLIDFTDGPNGSHRLGWTFWSRTLDPVRPDTEADRAACAPTNRDCLAQGRVSARRNAGEYALRVEVTSVIGSEEDRQRVLWGQSGMREHLFTSRNGSCAHRHDQVLDLLATEEPHDARAARACGLSGFVGRVTPDGRRYRPANFLKLEPDGTARFVVRCMAYMHDAPDSIGSYCRLQGYLGIWPLFLSVPSNRAAEWNETFLRVRDHLARSVVTRSD